VNPLRRLLLGSGRLPDDLRTAIAAEGPLLTEEGLPGSVTYRNYRAPGERAALRKEATTGAFAITGERLVVWAGGLRHIDVPHAHPQRATIDVTVDRPGRVCFGCDADATDPARSGRVEVRLRTQQASRVAELLGQLAAG
jgi:hypothetical protein